MATKTMKNHERRALISKARIRTEVKKGETRKLLRASRSCPICQHPKREEVELAFFNLKAQGVVLPKLLEEVLREFGFAMDISKKHFTGRHAHTVAKQMGRALMKEAAREVEAVAQGVAKKITFDVLKDESRRVALEFLSSTDGAALGEKAGVSLLLGVLGQEQRAEEFQFKKQATTASLAMMAKQLGILDAAMGDVRPETFLDEPEEEELLPERTEA